MVSALALLPCAPVGAEQASAPLAVASSAGDDPAYENGAIDALAGLVNGFQVNANVNVLFDGNIRRLGDGLSPAGSDRSDFRISPSVTVSYARPLGSQRVFVNGNYGRDFYARLTQFDSNRYGGNGGVQWQLGRRCSGLATIGFNSSQQLLSVVSQLDNNVREDFSVGGSGNCRVVGALGIGFSVQREQRRNSTALRQGNDLDSITYSPELTYGSPRLGRFSASGTLNRATYVRRTVFDTAGRPIADGVDFYSGRLGYQRGLGARLSINAGVSYFSTEPNPTTVLVPISPTLAIRQARGSQGSFGYDVGVSYESGRRLSASLSARRSASSSPNVGAQSQVSQRIAADVHYRLNRAISTDLGVNYDQFDYRGSVISANEAFQRRSDSIVRVFGSVSYSPVSLYSVSLEVAHQDRASNPALYSYASTSALLRLRVGFGRGS